MNLDMRDDSWTCKPNNSGGSWILEQYLKQQAVDFTKFAANQLVDRSINKAILNMIV